MTKILIADETGTLQDVGSIQNFVFDTMIPSNQNKIPIAIGTTNYIAPDNGKIYIRATSTTTNGNITLLNTLNADQDTRIASGTPQTLTAGLLVLKGTPITITSAGVTINELSFMPSAKAISEQLDMDIDYVIESSAPGANPWYRKYKSGYIEQGGKSTGGNATVSGNVVNIPIPMRDNNYSLTWSIFSSDVTAGIVFSLVEKTRNNTSFTYLSTFAQNGSTGFSGSTGCNWEVKGWAA